MEKKKKRVNLDPAVHKRMPAMHPPKSSKVLAEQNGRLWICGS